MKINKQDQAKITIIREALRDGKTVAQINESLRALGANVPGVPDTLYHHASMRGGFDYTMVIETCTPNPAWKKARRLCKQNRKEWSSSAAEMLFGPEMMIKLSHIIVAHEDEHGYFHMNGVSAAR